MQLMRTSASETTFQVYNSTRLTQWRQIKSRSLANILKRPHGHRPNSEHLKRCRWHESSTHPLVWSHVDDIILLEWFLYFATYNIITYIWTLVLVCWGTFTPFSFLSLISKWSEWQRYCFCLICVCLCLCVSVHSGPVNHTSLKRLKLWTSNLTSMFPGRVQTGHLFEKWVWPGSRDPLIFLVVKC